ncbi:hypothetical protein EB093_09795 [bacterium]|nr:hypothetical protein [bacterium]
MRKSSGNKVKHMTTLRQKLIAGSSGAATREFEPLHAALKTYTTSSSYQSPQFGRNILIEAIKLNILGHEFSPISAINSVGKPISFVAIDEVSTGHPLNISPPAVQENVGRLITLLDWSQTDSTGKNCFHYLFSNSPRVVANTLKHLNLERLNLTDILTHEAPLFDTIRLTPLEYGAFMGYSATVQQFCDYLLDKAPNMARILMISRGGNGETLSERLRSYDVHLSAS